MDVKPRLATSLAGLPPAPQVMLETGAVLRQIRLLRRLLRLVEDVQHERVHCEPVAVQPSTARGTR